MQRANDVNESINVKLKWSPGQANISGNEIADRLAKEAAREAEEMADDAGIANVPRENLRQSVLLSCGIRDLGTEILLSVTDDEELKELHPLIWDQLDMYITETKRF